MEIILIAAVDKNLAIGKNGQIPWKIKEDLKFFKEKTEGTSIIMGRSTFDSIGRPLPNRKNIVMTRSPRNRKGVIEVGSREEALKEASQFSKDINVININTNPINSFFFLLKKKTEGIEKILIIIILKA